MGSGRSISPRIEDRKLVTGTGPYVADLIDHETLHCAFVRSPLAHGRFDPPDLSAALAEPGVLGVFDADSLGLDDLPSSPGRGAPEATGMGRPPLARQRVRHVGDPIAVVVAESAIQAVDAAEKVWVDIDPLPAVTDVRSAMTDETLLFPDAGTNVVHDATISTSEAPPPVEVTADIEVEIPRLSPVTVEPLAILVRPAGEGLEVWCGHQSPARLPLQLGTMIGVDPALIRARVPFVGGAFGTKGQPYPEYVVVAALAHRLGRPVAWIQGRREQLLSGTHGRGQMVRARIGGGRDGRLRSLEVEILGDVGAYPSTGSRIPFFTQVMAPGQYEFEHLSLRAVAAVTNKAPTGPYRGAGRPEAAILVERAVDAFAAKAGLPPEDVRRLNYISSDRLPHATPTGAVYDSGDYRAALDLALETARVDQWRRRQDDRRRTNGDPIGIGIGSFIERAGGEVGSGEFGGVELRDDGTVKVRTGSTSAGQGHETVWSELAADVFAIDRDRVEFLAGDTAEAGQGVGSFGSRSAQVGASAVFRMASIVRDRAAGVAAGMLEAAEEDLELVDGRFQVIGSPGSDVGLDEIAQRARADGIELAAAEVFNPQAQTFPYGAYVAVVEVELETGEVHLLELVAVDDCGNILNPMIVEGQVHGSVMQGLGSALLEGITYDQDGQPLTSNLVSYLIPSSVQPLPLTTRRMYTPAPSNPLGVKGTGEAGCIGVPPAILNAVHDALGERVGSLGFPLTPARVWQALHEAAGAPRSDP